MGRRREPVGLLFGLLVALSAGLVLFLFVQPQIAATRTQVLAHRGASAYAPENTLAAFRLAVEQGADWLELDVQQTLDGRLVVFHDLRVERTTNGRGVLRDLTLEEVRGLDAGSWFGAQFTGERVPTFEEVLELARSAGVRVFPEVKDPRLYPGIEERLAAALRAYEYEEATIVQSFDPASLERLREVNPRLRLAALYTSESQLRGDPPAHAEVVGPPWQLILEDREIVREAHGAGRYVVVWSVDSPSGIRQMADAGVDGIITNRPDLARAILDERVGGRQ
jgi:glycerophosphoryl diester phosphodiesterase